MTDRVDQFWARVGPQPGGCWLWLGTRNRAGYGMLGTRFAHRIAYELFHGPIPRGLCVCHTCDVPACVHPNHLWLGTRAENIQDAVDKSRFRTGKHWRQKLSDAQVEEIRRRYTNYRSRLALAVEFKVKPNHIWRIATGRARR